MRIIDYNVNEPSLLDRLARLLPEHHGLRCRSFVDYYYTSNEASRLHLMLNDDDDILGVVGLERMNFSTPDAKDVVLGFGSNFHAFESGSGGLLFLHWLKQCRYGIVFGGNDNTQRIVEHQKWNRYAGVDTFQLNHAYAEVPGEAAWRKFAKQLLWHSPFRKDVTRQSHSAVDFITTSKQSLDRAVHAVPEAKFDVEMLPTESEFSLKFKPSVEHLNWRYKPGLPFVRYRVFRLTQQGKSVGYVVLNEQRNRTIVAQCDAPNSRVLLGGIFAALAQANSGNRRKSGVLLTSADPFVKSVLQQFGFRKHPAGRTLAIGGIGRKPAWSDDTSDWQVNFDWGDNGLRAPFLGAEFIETKQTQAA